MQKLPVPGWRFDGQGRSGQVDGLGEALFSLVSGHADPAHHQGGVASLGHGVEQVDQVVLERVHLGHGEVELHVCFVETQVDPVEYAQVRADAVHAHQRVGGHPSEQEHEGDEPGEYLGGDGDAHALSPMPVR